MKPAIIACLIMLPITCGVGWMADILTRDVMGAIAISHGDSIAPIIEAPFMFGNAVVLFGGWVVVSVLVLGLAALDRNGS